MLHKTAEALRLLGCDVTISLDFGHSLDGYDIVHLFNLTRPQETYYQARRATRLGIPVILSPIYVDYTEVDRAARGPLQSLMFRSISGSKAEFLKMLARNGDVAAQEAKRLGGFVKHDRVPAWSRVKRGSG